MIINKVATKQVIVVVLVFVFLINLLGICKIKVMDQDAAVYDN